jgi:hypothetical protein
MRTILSKDEIGRKVIIDVVSSRPMCREMQVNALMLNALLITKCLCCGQ